jgi:pyridoxal phosphate enzyme (YggS family)
MVFTPGGRGQDWTICSSDEPEFIPGQMKSMDGALIEKNLQRVQERIGEAALRSNRKPESVRLVAVTKSHPAQIVRIAYDCGLRHFGENRVGEALGKQAQLTDLNDVTWHMIGRIQSRKAKDVAEHFEFVHSIDRAKIAHRLDQDRVNFPEPLIGFLEVNASGEDTKTGWELGNKNTWDDFLEELKPLFILSHLRIAGLMTMAAWNADERSIRSTFARLREVRDKLEVGLSQSLPDLSMGMTDDFEIAIEEGATIVRVGRAIFGERQ